MKVSDKRKDFRYPIAALVSFWWSCQDGALSKGQGVTHNVSESGVWIVSNFLPPADAMIQMRITLPKVEGSEKCACLEGEGVVVRMIDWKTAAGARDGPIGFAAAVHFCLRPFNDSDLPNGHDATSAARTHVN